MVDVEALATTVSTTIANGMAGIVVALLAFPGRWTANYIRNRRQATVTTVREARRRLREASAFSDPNAFRNTAQALDDACWSLAELPGRRLYSIVERARLAYCGTPVVRMLGVSQPYENPASDIIDLVDGVFAARLRWPFGGLRRSKKRLAEIEGVLASARADVEAHHEQMRFEQLRWEAEEESRLAAEDKAASEGAGSTGGEG